MENKKINNVVLVHGAFADGSGFKALYRELTKKSITCQLYKTL